MILGNGDGTFGAPSSMAVGTNPASLVRADLNGDGRLDLAVLVTTNNVATGVIRTLLGDGTGAFALKGDYLTGMGSAYGFAAGDFNGDGWSDFFVDLNATTTSSVLLGNGDGSLQGPTILANGNSPAGAVVVDLNQDGRPDLVFSNSGDNNLGVMLNTSH